MNRTTHFIRGAALSATPATPGPRQPCGPTQAVRKFQRGMKLDVNSSSRNALSKAQLLQEYTLQEYTLLPDSLQLVTKCILITCGKRTLWVGWPSSYGCWHRQFHAALCAGVWVRVPSLLGKRPSQQWGYLFCG